MTVSIEQAMRRLGEEYELNASFTGFLYCGIVVRLGDARNGILAERNFALAELDQAGDWLLEQAEEAGRAEVDPNPRSQEVDKILQAFDIVVAKDARDDRD